MTPAETAAEREARAKLEALSRDLRENQRPPVRRAVDALLSGEAPRPDDPAGVLLELPRRSFRLRHRKGFKLTGAGTGALDLFVLQDQRGGPPIARLIVKTIHRTAAEMGSIQWLAEALFYLDLAPRISGEGITLPDVHGCKATAQGVTLVLSFIPPPQPPLSPHPERKAAARAIGRFGAVTHLRRLHEAGWLEAVRPRLMPETFLALEALVEAAFPDAAARERCLAAFEAFMGDAGLQRRLDEAGVPCLCHGDLHPKTSCRRRTAASPSSTGAMWAPAPSAMTWGAGCCPTSSTNRFGRITSALPAQWISWRARCWPVRGT